MGRNPDIFERIDEDLSTALNHADDETAKYHIRSAAQRLVIAAEDAEAPEPVEEIAE